LLLLLLVTLHIGKLSKYLYQSWYFDRFSMSKMYPCRHLGRFHKTSRITGWKWWRKGCYYQCGYRKVKGCFTM
jgi:hypothetical protein